MRNDVRARAQRHEIVPFVGDLCANCGRLFLSQSRNLSFHTTSAYFVEKLLLIGGLFADSISLSMQGIDGDDGSEARGARSVVL